MRKKKLGKDNESINIKLLNGQILFETDTSDFK